jgi:hypothetical protein
MPRAASQAAAAERARAEASVARGLLERQEASPPFPPPGTKRTRLVPTPVLTGHAASTLQEAHAAVQVAALAAKLERAALRRVPPLARPRPSSGRQPSRLTAPAPSGLLGAQLSACGEGGHLLAGRGALASAARRARGGAGALGGRAHAGDAGARRRGAPPSLPY